MNQTPERKSTSMWRRAVSFCLAMLMLLALLPTAAIQASAVSAGQTVYLKPNSNWLQASARFAAYFFGGSSGAQWVDMTDSDGDGYYSCTVPSGYSSVIFARMNPSTTANNWDNRWNQTDNLTLQSDSNCYTVADNTWDKGGGSWSNITFSLMGSLTDWSTGKQLTGTGTALSYTLELSAGTYQFKIKGSNGKWYGNSGTINDTASGWDMSTSAGDCTLNATGGTYTFTFDTTTSKLTVSHSTSGGGSTSGSRTIYFDATLSGLSYAGDSTAKTTNGIPGGDGKVYYYAYSSTSSSTNTSGTMTKVNDATYTNLYSVELDSKYDYIIFANYSNVSPSSLSWQGDSTGTLKLPDTTKFEKPCFYADSADPVIYSNYQGNVRDGYWGEAFQIRSAEFMKNTDIVDIESGAFEIREDYIYINTTFYDYYTDLELNGENRDEHAAAWNGSDNSFGSYQNWYTFRHFNRALSSYYSTNSARVPIYVGHFQPEWNDYNEKGEKVPWGFQFQDIADTLDLYGFMDGNAYGTTSTDHDQKYFMSVNNSNMDLTPTIGHVHAAAQGIVNSSLSNGSVLGAGSSSMVLPFFNEEFLEGQNSLNTKIGEVYHNVAFPFTFEDIHDDGIAYWVFDSSQTTRTMMKNDGTNTTGFEYYLNRVDDSATRERYKNLDSSSTRQAEYGFFPFNSGSDNGNAGTYNYGFGASMSLKFNLTKDGTVVDKYGNSKPIVFEFSGDDDLWVFIDGKLVLDIGGSHGKVSGSINFQDLTATVSSVKASGASSTSGENVTKSFTLTGDRTDDHTLTLFYMERGMWESNMRITFNFFPDEEILPETTSMTVTKEWKVESSSDIASSITVQLQQSTNGTTWTQAKDVNGSIIANATLSAGTNWMHTFSELPKYVDNDPEGTAYSYRVVEMNGGTALSSGTIFNDLVVTYGPVYGNSATGYGQLIINSTPPAGLAITKELAAGASGDWTDDLYPIQVSLNGSYLAKGTTLTTSRNRTVTVEDNGILYLYAGETVNLTNLDAGTSYVVSELDTLPGSEYVSSYDATTTSSSAPTTNANQVSGTLSGQSSTNITISNANRQSEHVVVIDFGLSVDITVMENDLAELDGEIYWIGSARNVSLGFGNTPGSKVTSSAGSHGTLSVNGDQVRYTPTKGDMQMATSDSFAYVIRFKNTDGSYGYYYGKVTVVPAANIYYEDNFLSFTDSTATSSANRNYGKWSTETSTDGYTQDEDRPGESALESIDANNVYGYDPAYGKCSEYSLDAARSVTVDATTGSANKAPTATFTFTGTGFDVVSLTSNTSGAILVEVYPEGSSTKVVSYIVNNYYGYAYNTSTGNWEIVDTNSTLALYQVPSIKVTDLTYGTYNVVIKAAYLKSMDDAQAGHYTIWVDAIRTYNPAQQDTNNDGEYENTFESIYEQDGESNPHLTTVKKLILSADTFDDGNTTANGVVYVDGKSANVTIADYADEGPNNETYLKNNNGIAFKLRANTTSTPDVIFQIGAKLAVGTTADLYCNNVRIATLETATNMFYKMGTISWNKVGSGSSAYYESEPIVLVCKNAGTSILSLTDLKLTGPDAGYIVADWDTSSADAQLLSVVDEDVMDSAQLYMAAVPEVPETEPTEPTEPETEPTEPETEPTEPETEPSEPETEPSEPEDSTPNTNFFDWANRLKKFIKFLFGKYYG